MSRVLLRKLTRQVLVDRSRPDDEQVFIPRQPRRDGVNEPSEMLEPVRLAGRLRRASATMSNTRGVSNVACRPVVRRHVRPDVIESGRAIDAPDDDGLAGVDPDEGDARGFRGFRPHCLADHERAHAGRSSASTARSA